MRVCQTVAAPGIAERQHGETRVPCRAAGPHGFEIGARHLAGIVAQAMSSDRLDTLKEMLARNPADCFARYGLAMERRNSGDLEGAMGEFRTLMAADPDYVPAYYHGGQTLERLGRIDEARQLYREGLDAAGRKGDGHAAGEIQFALDMLG